GSAVDRRLRRLAARLVAGEGGPGLGGVGQGGVGPGPCPAPPLAPARAGAVDSGGPPSRRSATLPFGGPSTRWVGFPRARGLDAFGQRRPGGERGQQRLGALQVVRGRLPPARPVGPVAVPVAVAVP